MKWILHDNLTITNALLALFVNEASDVIDIIRNLSEVVTVVIIDH